MVFGVTPTMPRSLKPVVIAARHNPGKTDCGSPGNGTLLHVATERAKWQPIISKLGDLSAG